MSTDKIELSDGLGVSDKKFRTEILFGYDCYKDKYGISQLGEQIIEPQHNKITLGGILYILKSTFGVSSKKVKIKTLNELLGINMNSSPTPGVKPVLGFNIGLGGCGASYADEKEVFKTVKQIYWHLKQIENKDYKISHLDLDDLKEAEDLLDNVVPYM